MSTVPDFSWLPSTRERFEHMLNVLPPATESGGGFLVGEAQHHDDAGYAYYSAHRCRHGEYQVGSRPLTVPEFRLAVLR